MSDESRPRTIAERRFAERRTELAQLGLAERFARMHETNLWDGAESCSGVGSSLAATARIRERLPALLRALGVRRLLDAPCGDFHWMRHVELGDIRYVGADIVPALIATNRARYGRPGRQFVVADITSGPLPPADAAFARDVLVHLSYENVFRALRVIRDSGARWLITTTFTAREANSDVIDGDWRPLNLERPPFSFPPPARLLVEECFEEEGAYADKSLGVWAVDDLPPTP